MDTQRKKSIKKTGFISWNQTSWIKTVKVRYLIPYLKCSGSAPQIYLSIYGCTALCLTLAAFSVYSSFTQSVGLLGREISPSEGRYLHIEQHKHRKTYTDIHVSWDIRTHDPSVWASEASSCVRPRGHCNRLRLSNTSYSLRQWLIGYSYQTEIQTDIHIWWDRHVLKFYKKPP
jgi:hypothetical protein